jgi:hypothetical protein
MIRVTINTTSSKTTIMVDTITTIQDITTNILDMIRTHSIIRIRRIFLSSLFIGPIWDMVITLKMRHR